jgi:death-on-curing protein
LHVVLYSPTFGGTELYPSIFGRAAAIGESLIINHPFINGNKRTGYVLMEALLRYEGYEINTDVDDLYNFIINISTKAISFEEIAEWLKNNTTENK